MYVAENEVDARPIDQFLGCTNSPGKVASETPLAHSLRQGLKTLVARADQQYVASLNRQLDEAKQRLTDLQHACIDLLDLLDPDNVRFPKSHRTKV